MPKISKKHRAKTSGQLRLIVIPFVFRHCKCRAESPVSKGFIGEPMVLTRRMND